MPVRPFPAALALLALLACARASNTPEEAFRAVRTAIVEERWQLLYDVLAPETQRGYDEQIAAKDAELAALARQQGPSAADALLAPTGLTHDAWKALDARDRFAGIFHAAARANFMQMGINEDHLRGAEVRTVETSGRSATVVVDDGKGHRTRLDFSLVDGTWRFDPGDV